MPRPESPSTNRRPHNQRSRWQALFYDVHTTLADTVSEEEIDIHFTHMPARYWPRAEAATVCEHLQLIRQFFLRLHAPNAAATSPVVTWRHRPERRITEVTICTWDRLGLLAHVAGAFAHVDLNILRADIYTRADHVALDVFEVTDQDGDWVKDESKLQLMTTLLDAALQPTATRPKPVLRRTRARKTGLAPAIQVGLDSDRAYSILTFEADDRVGLLYQVFTRLAECDISVVHAIITTEAGRAGDVLYVTDAQRQPVTDPQGLELLQERLLEVL